MKEKELTEKALFFKKRGWEVYKDRRTADGGCVVRVYVKRPGSNHELLLGQYEELFPESVAARKGQF